MFSPSFSFVFELYFWSYCYADWKICGWICQHSLPWLEICQLGKPISLQLYEWFHVGLYPFVVSVLDFSIWFFCLGVCHGEGPTGCFSWWLFSGLSAICLQSASLIAARWSRADSCTCCSHNFFPVTEHEHSPACLPIEHLCRSASVFYHAISAFLSNSNSLAVIRWVDTGCPEGLPVLMVQ